MKLRLEQQGEVKVLFVSDDVSVQHSAILKAGLDKIFGSGSQSVIVDLGGVTSMPEAAQAAVAALRELAADHGAQLLISSPSLPIADAADTGAAIQRMKSPAAGIHALEAKLDAKLRKLGRTKSVLEQKLAALQKGGADVKSLRKENSDLKLAIHRMEASIQQLLKERPGDASGIGTLQGNRQAVERALASVLQTHGVIARGGMK